MVATSKRGLLVSRSNGGTLKHIQVPCQFFDGRMIVEPFEIHLDTQRFLCLSRET